MSSINLRNLGSGRTLLELNGRRLADETVAVGGRIRGNAEAQALPVEVVGREDFEARGNPSTESIIRDLSEVGNVQGQSARGQNAAGYAGAAPAPAAKSGVEPLAPVDPANALRAAARAGSTAELETLLRQGAAVDSPDGAGDTALIIAVRARRTAAAALLIRYGASLDRRNTAGLSARDMARTLDDAAMNRALGL